MTRPDNDCPCNTGAGSTTVDTCLGTVVRVTACDTWGIWIDIEKDGHDISAQLAYDEVIQVRDALTKALEAVADPGESVTP